MDRSAGFIHVESFFKQKKPQPKWEMRRWFQLYFLFNIAQLMYYTHRFKSGISFFTFFALCFSVHRGRNAFVFHAVRADGAAIGIINHQFHFFFSIYCSLCPLTPTLPLSLPLPLTLTFSSLFHHPALIKHTLKATGSWVGERGAGRGARNRGQFFFLQNWLQRGRFDGYNKMEAEAKAKAEVKRMRKRKEKNER